MAKQVVPTGAVFGLVLGAVAALVLLGIVPTAQAKRALVEAAGPYALAAAGLGLAAFLFRFRQIRAG